MIKELTKEQTDKFPVYIKKWIDIGTSTDVCNMKKCTEFAKIAYQKASLEEPKYFLGPFNNPLEAAYAEKIIPEILKGDITNKEANKTVLKMVNEFFAKDENFEEVRKSLSVSNQIYGSMDASWLSFYDFFKRECDIKECEMLDGLMKISEVCGWWTPLRSVALFQHRPKAIHFDDRDRIHNPNGPAIEFRGSTHCNVYAWHGIRVKQNIIEKKFTAADIDAEQNAEIRRVMVEIYGQAKYLLDSKSEVVATDDWGTIYKKTQAGDEDLVMVKVVNSTPEPDGSFKDYFIRVEPAAYNGDAAKIPLAAVASTWRNTDGSMIFKDYNQYDPEIET